MVTNHGVADSISAGGAISMQCTWQYAGTPHGAGVSPVCAAPCYSECRQVVCRLLWERKVGCSIHPIPTTLYGKLAEWLRHRIANPTFSNGCAGSIPALSAIFSGRLLGGPNASLAQW